MERVFDCIPSLRSAKDFHVLCESGEHFETYYKPEKIEKVLDLVRIDQLGSGSCTGQALAKAKTLLEHLQNNSAYQFSPWWAWMNRPNNLSFLLETEGTSLKDAAEKLVEDGIVFLSQYDLNPDNKPNRIAYKDHKKKFLEEIRPQFLDVAKGYKADRYLFPSNTVEVKKAIKQLGCVCIAAPVYASFYKVKTDGVIPIPNEKKEHFMGYHAMIIYGWDDEKRVWFGDNSYGSDWGRKGFFTMPYDYPIAEFVALADDTMLNWADKYFYYLWKKGITLHERNFGKSITRAEVFAILARMSAGGDNRVPKLSYSRHWAERYFKYLNEHGVKIFEEKYEKNISRGEFMTLLYRALNKDNTKDVLQGKTYEHWAEVYYKALTKSMPIHERRFDENISRGEVMALIARALGMEV